MRSVRAETAVAIGSLLLSVIAWLVMDIVNNDAVLFIETAQAFWREGFASAFSLYRWPFYSILIGSIAGPTGLPWELVAYSVSAIATAAMGVGFLKLVALNESTNALRWYAVIVFLCLQPINAYRDYIIRDTGFWCAMVWAAVYLWRYWREPTVADAVRWQLLLAIAFLFRMEPVIYAAIIPILAALKPGRIAERARHILRLTWLGVIGIGATLVLTMQFSETSSMSRADELFSYFDTAAYTAKLENAMELVHTEILDRYTDDADPAAFVMIGLVGALVFKLLNTAGYGLIWLLGVGAMLYGRQSLKSINLLGLMICINIVLIYAFYILRFYIVGRYLVFLSLLLAVPATAWLARIVENRRNAPIVYALTIAILTTALLDAFISTGTNKRHIKTAGIWLDEHIGPNEKLLANRPQLYFYSGRQAFITEGVSRHMEFDAPLEIDDLDFDTLAVSYRKSPPELVVSWENSGQIEQQKMFSDKKNKNHVAVYRRIK